MMKQTLAMTLLLLGTSTGHAGSSVDVHLTGGELRGPLNLETSNESAFGGGIRGMSEFMPDFWGFGSIHTAPGDTIRYRDARVGLSYIPAAQVAFGVGVEFVHLSLTQEFRDSERGSIGSGFAPNFRLLASVSSQLDLEARAGGLFFGRGTGYEAEVGAAYRFYGNVSAILHAHFLSVEFDGEEDSFEIPQARVGIRLSY